MSSSPLLPLGLEQEPPSQVLRQTDPRELKPHSRNSSIYGDDEDITELLKLITQSGWVKPLVVTPEHVIISGHRRWKAALELGLESVPVEVREFPNQTAELEALLLENASRLKTTEQKVREAEAWKEVELVKAKDRQGTRTDIQENFPGCDSECDSGQVRDQVARRVGLGSGRTYEKAAKVVGVIDLDTLKGDLVSAQGLRQVLNEKSVDAAHTLAKKPPEERLALASLLVKGEAKSIKQAVKMINQNNDSGDLDADFSDPSKPSLAGFSVGDWVEINANAHAHNKTYIGQRGRIEQVLAAEKLFSVSFEGGITKVRFEPCELSLLVKAAPLHPVRVGDIVFVRIDRHEAASPLELKWNGYWGQVTQVGQMGSISVDVGCESLQLFPRDLKPVDQQSAELRQVVERVLHLRRLELDEVEERMLDVFQRREWLTQRQLYHLDSIEKFYRRADSHRNENHQAV